MASLVFLGALPVRHLVSSRGPRVLPELVAPTGFNGTADLLLLVHRLVVVLLIEGVLLVIGCFVKRIKLRLLLLEQDFEHLGIDLVFL